MANQTALIVTRVTFFLLAIFLFSGIIQVKATEKEREVSDSIRLFLDRSNDLAYTDSELSYDFAMQAYAKARFSGIPALRSEAAQVLGYSYYDQRDFKKAEQYLLQALEISKKYRLYSLNEKNHNALYQLYRRMEDFEKAKIHIDQAHVYAVANQDPIRLANILKGRGQLYEELGVLEKALSSLLQAIQVLQKDGKPMDYSLYIDCETSLALVYKELEDYHQAHQYLIRALDHAKLQQLPVQTLYAHLNLGLVYKKLADKSGKKILYDSAMAHNRNALSLAEKQRREPEIGMILNNMAFLAFELDDLPRAKSWLDEAIPIKQKTGNLRSLGFAYWLKGKIIAAEEQTHEAVKVYQDAISYAKKGKALSLHIDIIEDLSEEYFKQKDLQAYRNSLDVKEILTDSLINLEKAKNIANAEILYKSENKSHSKKSSLMLPEKSSTFIQGGLTLLAFSSMVFLIYFYYKLSIKEKLLRVFDRQLRDSNQKQERLQKKLLEYSENLANSMSKNQELLRELEKSSLNFARQEALEKLARFKISKQEDCRTFRLLFEKVFPGYWECLKRDLPELSENELLLAALFKLGMSTREMASLLGISYEGTKKARYRFKKKINTISDNYNKRMLINGLI